jgi:hypothetical protein
MPAWESMAELVDMLTPGNFDKKELTPFYEKIYAKYQAASKDNIMMFEPGQFPDMFGLGTQAVVW